MTTPDATDLPGLQKQLIETTLALAAMEADIAAARQIREWDGERRRAILSKNVVPLLGNESVAAAEHKARASEGYRQGMDDLKVQFRAAEAAIARWDALRIKADSLRSILSTQRTLATM